MSAFRAAFLAIVVTLAIGQSLAEDALPPASPVPEEDPWQACAAVAIDPSTINVSLERFEVVFGKDALEWTNDDYQQVIDLAFACDGVMGADGVYVDARAWAKQIQDAKNAVYPVAGMHREIMRHADALGGDDIKLPPCKAFMAYTWDDWAFTDNINDIVGYPFLAMTDMDLRRLVEHSNNCLAFLPDFNKRILGGTMVDAKDRLYAVMDRSLLIQKRREDFKLWRNKRPTDLIVTYQGVAVPPTFVSQRTRKLVDRYNKAISYPGGLSMETISALIAISDEVIEERDSAIDIAYAEEIKKNVQRGIFDRAEHKLQ